MSGVIPAGTIDSEDVTALERQLAARNHGLLLEALRYDTTPIGLHYLLIHFDVPVVDASTWRLDVGGLVGRALSLSLEEVEARPSVTRRITFECAGNGRMALRPRPLSQPWGVEAVGTAEWTGTPLWPLLEEAGISKDAVEVVFSALDTGVENQIKHRFERSLTIAEAQRGDVLLVHKINGLPLPPQHGFPLRLLVPGWYGMTNVKWLDSITVVDKPFDGYQQRHAYRLRRKADEPGVALNRIRPRALMVAPGVPEFYSRERTLAPGPVTLEGRGWSGFGKIREVQVTTDGGSTWVPATLEDQPDPYAWVRWTFDWDATPGVHVLGCRASDEAGERQPLEPEWNLGGYACNAVTYSPVSVTSD